MQNLNVGLIGGGFMGKAHSLAYAAMPMFFWPAPALPVRKVIAEANPELAAEAARRFGFENSTSDWRSIIDDPDILAAIRESGYDSWLMVELDGYDGDPRAAAEISKKYLEKLL